ncbi:MAG: NTP/NDP exchange transporter [Proteobacteria bacterium]|nr:NTP/NDP exchange transporter [Pseudomonadota bacterium]
MSNSLDEPHLSKIRITLWPIQNSELKKFLPMGMMMFLVLFDYTLLRNTKDALLITAPMCGAEVIPFLKIGDIPCAILFFFIYAKLSNILSREKLFYSCLIPFLIFFGVFAFIIYPNREFLHPTLESVITLREAYPHLKWFISIYGVWSFGIFYILSELFGVIIIALLFWQFANEVTRTNEAKRFYPFFGFLGNIALMTAGTFGEYLAQLNASLPSEADAWGMSISYIITSVVAAGTGVICIYWWMNRYVLIDPFYYDGAKPEEKKKDKPKLSIGESLSYLLSSKYLGFIAILVVSYGITANIIDVTWKSQVKDYFPKSNDYFAFMGRFSYWTGIATMALIMTTKGIVRRFGWFTGAIITPSMFLITSALFFTFILFKDSLESPTLMFGVGSLYMAVMIGATQNILSKGMKYSLFDPTKEMAYIPLDQELKVKGKAAVDVIGSRLGKSGGGFIQFILLTLTAGTQMTILPYLCAILIVVMLTWMGAVKGLSKLYTDKLDSSKKLQT